MTQPIGEAVASAAESLIGAPFRLHGRNPKTGIDCVGVAISALARGANIQIDPGKYGLRNLDISAGCKAACSKRLSEPSDAVTPGDIVLTKTGPAAFHLLVAGFAERFIHSHAGLRRVVAMPGPLGWPVIRRWRPLPGEIEYCEEI